MWTGTADAIRRGVAFLASTQHPSGELQVLASGQPDPSVFPTAVMTHSLSFVPEADEVRAKALDFLEEEMSARGLWRHWPQRHPQHHLLPPDLDDTSCAAATLRAAGRTFPDQRGLLLANRTRQGLFRTWVLTRTELRHPLVLCLFFHRTSARPFDVDAVVNANVVHYLGPRPETRAAVDFLLRVLRDHRERACDKWYDDPFAVWYFFSRALRATAPEAGLLFEEKLASANPAHALHHALAACVRHDWQLPVSVAPLLALQREDGSWPAAPLYHGGRRRRRDGTFDAPHPDTPHWGSDELTTAFAIEALARARTASPVAAS
jgi:hypothetical protein